MISYASAKYVGDPSLRGHKLGVFFLLLCCFDLGGLFLDQQASGGTAERLGKN
jgi:hypothetical protein